MATKQIKEYYGKRVGIELVDGSVVEGVLAYYNFDNQTITINDYVMHTLNGDQFAGKIKMINNIEWRSINCN
jgi:small nuclear ribonucleoprotein (snRNP)-like protein